MKKKKKKKEKEKENGGKLRTVKIKHSFPATLVQFKPESLRLFLTEISFAVQYLFNVIFNSHKG